jgi:eukaryotic-like serine/threonine-protein kinase
MFKVYAETRYEQLEEIGKGEGMNSTVFRAYDPYLEREIAVKEIGKAQFGNDFAAYCAEARVMFALDDPNIIPIKYVCETAAHVALALPYFSNGSLKRRIKDSPIEMKHFLRMSHDVLSGVSKIHKAKLLHLDLKPSNILFDHNGSALVADFGQARRVTSAGVVKFPAVYKWSMPPEVWDSHVATVESDIYQLGVLLYRASNGDPVYLEQKNAIGSTTELQKRILRGRFPDRKAFLPHVPARVRSIIRKAMKVNPAERYHSVAELAAALGRVPLSVNWSIEALGGGAYSWHAIRTSSTNLRVELSQDSSKWRTRVWTEGQEQRAKGLSDYWKTNLSYEQACTHLTEVFGQLSR